MSDLSPGARRRSWENLFWQVVEENWPPYFRRELANLDDKQIAFFAYKISIDALNKLKRSPRNPIKFPDFFRGYLASALSLEIKRERAALNHPQNRDTWLECTDKLERSFVQTATTLVMHPEESPETWVEVMKGLQESNDPEKISLRMKFVACGVSINYDPPPVKTEQGVDWNLVADMMENHPDGLVEAGLPSEEESRKALASLHTSDQGPRNG